MTTDIIKIDSNFLNLLISSFGKDGLPLPFVQEIFLMQCHVAGTTFREKIEDIEPSLQEQDILIFKRETDNKHDKLAILIVDKNGQKLGYVPRAKNEVIARLMDAGKLIFGKIEQKEWQGDWLKIAVKVFMRDM
jgi:hypothetical protein